LFIAWNAGFKEVFKKLLDYAELLPGKKMSPTKLLPMA